MSKFAAKSAKTPVARHVVKSVGKTFNHEGVSAFTRDSKSDLFLLGVVNFVSEKTFYEGASGRDARYLGLVHTVTKEDPTWVANFVTYLRSTANMRSVAVVTAVEYVRAGGPNGRSVINAACQRADEPAEVLAYWLNNYGRPIPSSVKRGVADAARRLYNEYSFIKYDGNSKVFRFADVIQLAHVKPVDATQSALFKLALDSRYNNASEVTEALPMVASYRSFNSGDREVAREVLLKTPGALRTAGMTWESLSSFGPMDKDAWEAAIPTMGYMALLRNLRNFDEAGVSEEVADTVMARLSDPVQVAKSRQLPFRFYSAYKNAPSLRWGRSLETGMDLSLKNIPAFKGKTLVLVDTSGSMSQSHTTKSDVTPLVAAAIFGAALAKSGQDVDLVMFGTTAKEHIFPKGGSTLATAQSLTDRCNEVGYGTNISGAFTMWKGHDRIILISDMQTTRHISNSVVPNGVPVYAFNLGAYGSTVVDPSRNMYEFGGLTDSTFTMINSLEAGRKSEWPWNQK